MADPNVRFIRVNGRVIPIKSKDPSKAQLKKNYNKYGDGANQASRIDEKYEKKAKKGTGAHSAVAVAGLAGAYLGRKNKFAVAAGIGATFAAGIMAKRKQNQNRMKHEASRQREYVKTFGVDSEGNRPTKRRSAK